MPHQVDQYYIKKKRTDSQPFPIVSSKLIFISVNNKSSKKLKGRIKPLINLKTKNRLSLTLPAEAQL